MGNKKKIMIIHHSGLIGGAGVSLLHVWQVLQQKYDMTVYITTLPSDLYNFLKVQGLDANGYSMRLGKITYYSGGNNLMSPRFWYHALNTVLQIPYWIKCIKKEQPDLIMVNSKVLCWMGSIFKKQNVKSLCFVRETIPGNPRNFMNRIMNRMLEDFTSVSFLSKYDRDQTNLRASRSVISPDFLEPEQYIDKIGREEACRRLKLNPNSFNVLFVGGINELKGIEVVVSAISELKNENISLIVAGKGYSNLEFNSLKSFLKYLKLRRTIKFSNKIKSLIENEKIENKIKFIGVQTDMSIPFSACDVLVFPMNKPHQARPAFEIGIQKKPVIISDFPNIKEFIKDGFNGLVFEPGNAHSLAEAILRLKNNEELLKFLGENNYAHAISQHTKEAAMANFLKEIDELLH